MGARIEIGLCRFSIYHPHVALCVGARIEMVIICSLDDVQKVALCVGARIEISSRLKAISIFSSSPFVWGRGLKLESYLGQEGSRGRPLCGGED